MLNTHMIDCNDVYFKIINAENGLNAYEKLICLIIFSNGNEADISLKEFSDKTSVTKKTVLKAIDSLVEKGVISRRRQGLNKNNIYILKDIPEILGENVALCKRNKIKPEPHEETGIVYVMKNCGYYKIGRSKLHSTRFGEYTKLPEEPEYIIKEIVNNYRNVELALHEQYKDKRLRGGTCEWFDLSDDDLEEIKKYVEQYKIHNLID